LRTARAALKGTLMPVLAKIEPSMSYNVLTDYRFANDTRIDRRLLAEPEHCDAPASSWASQPCRNINARVVVVREPPWAYRLLPSQYEA
jgi:hypothetical protein